MLFHTHHHPPALTIHHCVQHQSNKSCWGAALGCMGLGGSHCVMQNQRTLRLIHSANPKHGLVHLFKVVILDRVGVQLEHAVQLAALSPTLLGEEPLNGIPLTPPTDWGKLPPAFCAATKNGCRLGQLPPEGVAVPQPWHLPQAQQSFGDASGASDLPTSPLLPGAPPPEARSHSAFTQPVR